MPEVTYKEFEDYLKKEPRATNANRPQVYLFYGEELLYKKAFESFLEHMVPLPDRITNCEPVDGAPENIRDAVNRANTFSMLSGNKIVSVQESRIFYGNQEKGKLLERAKEAFRKDEKRKASKYLLSLLGQSQLRLEDVSTEETLQSLLGNTENRSDDGWILELIAYCRENGLAVPSADRPDQFLETAILKGFPPGNYLALTTDLVDKRRTLFKSLRETGVVVDCSVPKGDRRADRIVQEEVLRSRIESILGGSKKTLMPQAFQRLYDMTGFDLRTFSNSLEKLVLYVGSRPVIAPEDVTAVLKRSKQDPIYDLTGAVSDRDLAKALMLLESLLHSGLHYLQIFTAIVNQMRKLLLAKTFISSQHGHVWQAGMPYNVFTTRVVPAMLDYDQELLARIESWDEMLTPEATENETGKKKSTKKKKNIRKLPAELMVAANPKNAYPIYLTLKKADNFTMEALCALYTHLGDTDMRLKRSAHDPKLVLEETLLKICRMK